MRIFYFSEGNILLGGIRFITPFFPFKKYHSHCDEKLRIPFCAIKVFAFYILLAALRAARAPPRVPPILGPVHPSGAPAGLCFACDVIVISIGGKIQMYGFPDGGHTAPAVGGLGHDAGGRASSEPALWGSWDPKGQCPPTKLLI